MMKRLISATYRPEGGGEGGGRKDKRNTGIRNKVEKEKQVVERKSGDVKERQNEKVRMKGKVKTWKVKWECEMNCYREKREIS